MLFVGAGLSRGAGYPGWKELMQTVVRETAARLPQGASGELDALLAAGRYPDLADQCREILGR